MIAGWLRSLHEKLAGYNAGREIVGDDGSQQSRGLLVATERLLAKATEQKPINKDVEPRKRKIAYENLTPEGLIPSQKNE